MRLTDNKEDRILNNKIFDSVRWKEMNIRKSNWDIEYNQIIWLDELVTSEYLMRNIYDEINRE